MPLTHCTFTTRQTTRPAEERASEPQIALSRLTRAGPAAGPLEPPTFLIP